MPRANRRSSRSEPFWRDLITRWKTSGQSVAAFCAASLLQNCRTPCKAFRLLLITVVSREASALRQAAN